MKSDKGKKIVSPLDLLTREEISKLAEEQLNVISNKVGQDVFFVNQVLRHMEFIFNTDIILSGKG